MEKSSYIKDFSLDGLWGDQYFIDWHDIDPKVNILVGINGAGKTTLLNVLYSYYTSSTTYLSGQRGMAIRVVGTPLEDDVQVKFIHSFDVPNESRSKKKSPIMDELEHLIIKNKAVPSFFDYRMRALNYPEEREQVEERIQDFFATVDSFFKDTDKQIEIDREENSLNFRNTKTNQKITIDQLSAGEKQLMVILLTVFLCGKKAAVILMDEPVLSLHLTWQEMLIEKILHLNPNCQLIITTHSPSIFADGWEDKIVYMDDLLKPYQND